MSESRDTVVAADRDEGGTRVNELRRNVEDTRDSLAESLSTLKARLSPSEMLASTKISVQQGVRRTVNEAAQELREGSERLTRAIRQQPGWAALATAAAASTVWYFSREPTHRSKRGVRRAQPQPHEAAATATAKHARRTSGWGTGVASGALATVAVAALASRRQRGGILPTSRPEGPWGRTAAAGIGRSAGVIRERARGFASDASRAVSGLDASTAASVGSAVGILVAFFFPASAWERKVAARAQQSITRAVKRTVHERTEQAQRTLMPAVSAMLGRAAAGQSRSRPTQEG